MMDRQQVLDWIDTLPQGSGLTLVEVDAQRRITETCLEVGMAPDEEDEIDGCRTQETIGDTR